MAKLNVNDYVAWLKEQAALKRPYWYGTCGYQCSESVLKSKAKQYPSHYGSSRMARYRRDIAAGQICADCVGGAIKWAVWSQLGTQKNVYKSNGCPDTSANGMFKHCKNAGMDWGAIDTLPEKPGVAVRFDGHVGVYVGGGEVVEWRGFKYGCVVTKVGSRPWTHWYAQPWVDYDDQGIAQEPADDAVAVRATLRKGDKGEAVKALQKALVAAGYKLPKYGADGDFGGETLEAVEAFQMAEPGLEVDGIVGPKTWAALDAAQKPAGGAVTAHRTLHKGDEGDEVKLLQEALMAAGCKLPKYGADGDFGKETLEAVKAFQKAKGLTVDGIVGPKTWAALEV